MDFANGILVSRTHSRLPSHQPQEPHHGNQSRVWIDHARAYIVLLTELGEEIGTIESGIEKPARPSAATRAKTKSTPNDFVAEGKLERKRMALLNEYYDEVVACLRDAEAVIVLGPGEAKAEFKKRIKSKALLARVAEPISSDKMTERQLVAKVRQHFTPASKKPAATKSAAPKKKAATSAAKKLGKKPRK